VVLAVVDAALHACSGSIIVVCMARQEGKVAAFK